ncbi:MAG TPA: FixH family protein [Chryseolinea sp.]|nr:FixH family protein [Chryseolinea sp.]
MNPGKWIVVSFILFAIFIGTLVTVCVRQDISLVSENYYKEELVYQDQIQRLNNTELLVEKPAIKVVDQMLQIEFNQSDKVENGALNLFCPANEKMDRKFLVEPSGKGVQSVELGLLQKGMYRARLSWTMNGKEFYMEEVINI